MKKVLIVDDNDANLYLLKSMLEDEGFTVVAAENGQVALDSAHADPPDLIVSDILMPVMDGYALCRRWKSDDTLKHIPLVFYTATYTGSKNENFALSLGADRFILKPQEPDNLMDILKEVLEESYVAKQVAAKPLEEEMEVFSQYNEILFSKLEKKMSDLEIANQELRESEERYRRVSSMTSDITYSCSTREDGRFAIEWMTGATEHISGYSIEEIKVQNCWRFMVIEEDLALFEEKVINLAPGSHGFCELRIRHRNGDIVWLASHAECVMDTETPERFHLYGSLVDITASKQAEEKENETSALLRIAGEKAKLGGWSVNLEENRVSWSDEVAAIHEMPAGYSPSVEQGISFYAPEWRERITTVFTDCAQKGIPYDEEMEIIAVVWVVRTGDRGL